MLDMLPDARSLQIAAAVVECGSMSEAGVRFGITQPAVSQVVRRVEEAIGAPLLHRDRRPLVATRAGLTLVAEIRELRREIERVVLAARAAAALPERLEVRLGLVDTVAGTIGPYLVKELMEEALTLRLTTWSGLSFSHTQDLTRHAIDVAVTSDPMEGLTEITQHPLYREPFLLVVPKAVAPAMGERDLKSILSAHNLIRHSARSHMGQQIERHLNRLQLDPPLTLEFDTSDAIMGMVSTGIGVAVTTPLCVLQGAAHIPQLEIRPLPGPLFVRELALATRKGEFVDLAERMAKRIRDLLQSRALPQILGFAPWLGSEASGLAVHK